MLRFRTVYLGWKDCSTSHALEMLLARETHLIFKRSFSPDEGCDQKALARLRADFLFVFGPIEVKPVLAGSITTAAINFHLGAPEGMTARHHGVTAHSISEHGFHGPVLDVIRFPLNNENALQQSLKHIIPLAEQVLDRLKRNNGVPSFCGSPWRGHLSVGKNNGPIQPMLVQP